MKRIIIKGFIVAILISIVHVVLNAFATPISNNVALLQLEDSNTALATFNAFQFYGKYIGLGIDLLIVLLFFGKDIYKVFKK